MNLDDWKITFKEDHGDYGERWDHAHHWKARVKAPDGTTATFTYHHPGRPDEAELRMGLLKSLALDIQYTDFDFYTWAEESGFDLCDGEREARRVYRACLKQAEKVERVFGNLEEFDEAVQELEEAEDGPRP